MTALRSLPDSEILARLPLLVQTERCATAELIEHLVEVERRRLYLGSVSSLYRYCIEKLGYAEDAALKRHRVAKLALRLPQVLDELRAGTMHLTGLFLLSSHLTEENAAMLLAQSRGKSRRHIEALIAHWFPRPDVPARITCPGAGEGTGPGWLEPLSRSRVRVEFTARAEIYDKVERARQLLSHRLPSGDLGELFERALDALIEKQSRRRRASEETGQVPKVPVQREARSKSRYIPVQVERAVWHRDDAQGTFVGGDGHRCAERRFLTIEHRVPFALGGLPTIENLCLLCSAHNLANARSVFGTQHVETKVRQRKAKARGNEAHFVAASDGTSQVQQFDVSSKVLAGLCHQGFRRNEALSAIGQALAHEPNLDVAQLLRKSLLLLVPAAR